jgi:peptidoglycan/LPS O-acetylase OafA/YrhL
MPLGKSGRMNNFHFVRLIASLMVLFSHSFYLFSKDSIDPLHYLSGGIFTFGNIGVYVFLIVSGYLITQSLINSKTRLNFLWRRVIRIFPALWVMILLSVFLFGPLMSKSGFIDYYRNLDNYDFLKNIFLFVPNNFKIPSVFSNNPIGTYNGCLWTITYEVYFYLILVLFYVLRLFRFKILLLAQWLIFIFIQHYLGDKIYIYSYSSPWILNLNLEQCFRLFIFFEAGVILYLFKEIFSMQKFFIVLFICSGLVSYLFGFSNLTIDLILPPLVIYFAISNNYFSFFEKYGDYSYGIYLYGYIIQQFLVSLHLSYMNEYLLFLLSLLITFIVAFLSWNLVEKPMVKLKSLVN